MRQQGGDSEEAAAAAGMITGIAQTFAMVFSIFAGLISTRLNAMLALLLMSMTAVLGYGGSVAEGGRAEGGGKGGPCSLPAPRLGGHPAGSALPTTPRACTPSCARP